MTISNLRTDAQVKILDGNAIAASEDRLKVLGSVNSSLYRVYRWLFKGPSLMLAVDVFPHREATIYLDAGTFP